MRANRSAGAWLTLYYMCLLPCSGMGQVRITVEVFDSITGWPVAGATAQLLNRTGETVSRGSTDRLGAVELEVQGGPEALQLEAFGYLPWRGVPKGPVVARMVPEPFAVPLLGVAVESGAGLAQFRRRRAIGVGVFLDPGDVFARSRYGVFEVFGGLERLGIRRSRQPNAKTVVRSDSGAGCLAYRINHVPVRPPADWDRYPLSGLLPQDLIAVEIYRHFGEVPPPLRADAGLAATPCGLIILWTTEGWLHPPVGPPS